MSRRRRKVIVDGGALNVRAGLAAWYDASDTSASNIVQVGGSVSQWSDKSGNGNHVEQDTGSAQPTTNATTQNGKNVLDWDGANTFLAITDAAQTGLDITGDATFFAVISPVNTNVPRQMFCKSLVGNQNAGYRYRVADDDSMSVVINGDVGITDSRSTTDATQDAFSVQTAVVDVGTNIAFREDGVSIGTPSLTNASIDDNVGPFHVGNGTTGGEFFNGSMGEILIYNGKLTAAEISSVEAYLLNKWGL